MEESSRKPKKRQKLCHNCEGEIDIDVIVCPFCAADLREEKSGQSFSNSIPRAPVFAQDQQTSQSLYPPPFAAKQPAESESSAEAKLSNPAEGPSKNIFAPTVLFTLGVQLVLLGLLMLLFSHKGVVVLKWNAHLWFLFCTAGFPFLYFGFRALSKL